MRLPSLSWQPTLSFGWCYDLGAINYAQKQVDKGAGPYGVLLGKRVYDMMMSSVTECGHEAA
jgi:hypothetical protein